MTTNAKVGIAVAALVVLVFGVTIISQLPKGEEKQPGAGVGGGDDAPKEGLQAGISSMRYEPDSPRAAYREYQQYYEVGEHPVAFWVSNPNPVAVSVTFTYTSCGACSFADLAVVKDPPVDPDSDPDPFGAVFGGVIGGRAGIGDAAAAFGLDLLAHKARAGAVERIPPGDWTRLKAANSTRDDAAVRAAVPAFEVPAAAGDKPAWVVVRLNIKVSEPKTLETTFSCQRADGGPPIPLRLYAAVAPVEPCNVSPSLIDFKSIPEGTPVVEETVYWWSATRGFATSPDGLLGPLPPPDVAAVNSRVKHLSFSPPVPATAAEMLALGPKLALDPKAPPMRVAAAYKTTVRFTRTAQADGKTAEADLGPFERSLGLPPDGTGLTLTKTPTLVVRGVVQGAVRLVGPRNVKDDKIDFGSFSARDELVREVVLTSDRPGLELEAVPEQSTPKYLKLDPDIKAERKGDRTVWTITLRIDKGVGGGEMQPGSSVVVRIKNTGQLLRLPVTGRGTS